VGDRADMATPGNEEVCLTMSAHDWQKVEELLHQAMALAPERRAEFLDGACGSDAELRAELNSLLMVGENLSDEFLNSPLRGVLDGQIGEIDSGRVLAAGQIFAQRYELIRKLGEGGMGQVWLAEQVTPVRRQVALKLIKAGMYDEAVVQRFQSERQSLAIMDHPAIAKVFDAGTTPQGQPYLVMEYVPGLPITEYCDQHKLIIRDRLELFIQACEGVQHAHQKAIIHRDLKPSNILVIEVDGKPTPRIIDFGLAKTTAAQVSGESLFTQVGQFIGTPGYMSPEQVNLSGRDIDTRTDVYTLGVVLYVLLTGLQPFEIKRREKPSLEEWLRQLREEEPPNPSTKVSGDKDTSSATAEARSTEPKQLVSLLRGDLDWITMKALDRDRERRYGTPSELAADLRRYLDHEPVTARPASAGYRLRKYARRHRVAVGVGAGLVAILAIFSVVQTLQLRETTQQRDHAKQERDRANQERDRAARITDFMTNMFKVSDPGGTHGSSVTAREILDKASNEIGKGLAQDPALQSQMLSVMAWSYENLELYAQAHELAQRALNMRLDLHGADDRKTLESMTQLGRILNAQGHFADAENLERQALVSERRVLGPEDRQTLETMDQLATIWGAQGHPDEEEKLEREVIEIATRTQGPESDQTLSSTMHLAWALQNEGRYQEAEQSYRRLLDIQRRIRGPDSPEALGVLGDLALAIQAQGRLAEAATLDREVLATTRRVLGPEHPNILGIMINLANNLMQTGGLAEAEKLMREALALIKQRNLDSDYPNTPAVQFSLVQILLAESRLQEAEKLNREVMASTDQALGADNPNIAFGQYLQSSILIKEGRYKEAETLARGALEVERRTPGLGQMEPNILQLLGSALAHDHRYGEARKLFQQAIDKKADSQTQMLKWYMYATVTAVAGHADDAIQYLREAVKLGYKSTDGILADENLKTLHSNPKFQQLVAELKRPPSSAKPE
jgi:eukaryotic-like serine/threonine-protein kinase